MLNMLPLRQLSISLFILSATALLFTCSDDGITSCNQLHFAYTAQAGCDGLVYPNPATSAYVLPFEAGKSYETGLTNCSSSYHGPGQPDRYATDFNMPEGTPFLAARGGVVYSVVESAPSTGGGAGNSVVINHGDNSYGVYLHSPQNGIAVSVGQTVSQGQVLGNVGRSGLAGYPHLHFIVVTGNPAWPWTGTPVTFRNVSPADVVLKGNTMYSACK